MPCLVLEMLWIFLLLFNPDRITILLLLLPSCGMTLSDLKALHSLAHTRMSPFIPFPQKVESLETAANVLAHALKLSARRRSLDFVLILRFYADSGKVFRPRLRTIIEP